MNYKPATRSMLKLAPAKLRPLVLGIDSGASKTSAAVANDQGMLGLGKSGPGNIHTTSETEIIKHLKLAVAQAISNAHLSPLVKFSSVVVGMAGINSPHDLMKAERLVHQALHSYTERKTHIQIVNDIHLVRRSGSNDPYGVALIAGTGTHCFGVNPKGDIAYAGGLDYILADEGSGYEMGLKVLRAAVRSADGRIKPTQLEGAVLKHFKVRSIRALEPIAYHQHFGKTDIAKLAKLADAYAKTDWCAKQIIAETLSELTSHVAAVVKRLHLKPMPFDLVVAGGLFEISSVPFLAQFTKALKTIAPHVSVVKPNHPPVWGAVKLAQDAL